MITRLTLRKGLATYLPEQLVDELLAAYFEVLRNYYLGGLRLSAVEGGRFAEALFRILEQITAGTYTPLGVQLDTERLIRTLGALPAGSHKDSVRLHMPRALRLVYDIRNKRDAAHLADDIDPNQQDASLVVGVVSWLLAELIRMYHDVNADEAQAIVVNLVTRQAPIIEEFDGFLKVLSPRMSVSDHVLVLLYHRGDHGATFEDLQRWVRPPMRTNLRRTLSRLVNERDLAHHDGTTFRITRLGQQVVERHHLLEPDAEGN